MIAANSEALNNCPTNQYLCYASPYTSINTPIAQLQNTICFDNKSNLFRTIIESLPTTIFMVAVNSKNQKSENDMR